jgi:hypothetical protein
MTHDEMIAVIQAHKDGKVIQECTNGRYGNAGAWGKSGDWPVWDFRLKDYRVKPMPKEYWLVPYKNKFGFIVFGSSTKNLDSDSYNDKLDFANTIHVVTVVEHE